MPCRKAKTCLKTSAVLHECVENGISAGWRQRSDSELTKAEEDQHQGPGNVVFQVSSRDADRLSGVEVEC